jgi:hypothetical protein
VVSGCYPIGGTRVYGVGLRKAYKEDFSEREGSRAPFRDGSRRKNGRVCASLESTQITETPPVVETALEPEIPEPEDKIKAPRCLQKLRKRQRPYFPGSISFMRRFRRLPLIRCTKQQPQPRVRMLSRWTPTNGRGFSFVPWQGLLRLFCPALP